MEERQRQEIEHLKRSHLLKNDVSQTTSASNRGHQHVHPSQYTGSHSVCLPSQVGPSSQAYTQHSHGLTHSASASQLRQYVGQSNAPAGPTNATASQNSVPTSPVHQRAQPTFQSSTRPQ